MLGVTRPRHARAVVVGAGIAGARLQVGTPDLTLEYSVVVCMRALEAELYFFCRLFGIEPADKIEPVDIENL